MFFGISNFFWWLVAPSSSWRKRQIDGPFRIVGDFEMLHMSIGAAFTTWCPVVIGALCPFLSSILEPVREVESSWWLDGKNTSKKSEVHFLPSSSQTCVCSLHGFLIFWWCSSRRRRFQIRFLFIEPLRTFATHRLRHWSIRFVLQKISAAICKTSAKIWTCSAN